MHILNNFFTHVAVRSLVCFPLDPELVSYFFVHWDPVHFHWATVMVGMFCTIDPEIHKV